MKNCYDTEFWNPTRSEENLNRYKEFYSKILGSYQIETIHDCSMGSGNLTYPFHELGYKVSGSDINKNMLDMAKQYIKLKNYTINVYLSDFREIDKILSNRVDCIVSTGNSLPHVNNDGVKSFLDVAGKCVKDGGLLYFDMRNWDKILKNRQRFFQYDLEVTDKSIRHFQQIWDYNKDNSIEFTLIFTDFDRNGVIKSVDIQKVPAYYPILKDKLELLLNDSGFRVMEYYNFDLFNKFETKNKDIFKIKNHDQFLNIDWYAVVAEKK